MRPLHQFFAFLLLPAAAFAAAAAGDIEFNGVVVTTTADGKEKVEVSLLNRNTGNAKWVPLKGKFDGLVVTSYDDKGLKPMTIPDVLLTKDTAAGAPKQTMRVQLKTVTIANSPNNGQNPNGGGTVTAYSNYSVITTTGGDPAADPFANPNGATVNVDFTNTQAAQQQIQAQRQQQQLQQQQLQQQQQILLQQRGVQVQQAQPAQPLVP